MLSVDFSFCDQFVDDCKVYDMQNKVLEAQRKLYSAETEKFTGWLNLPVDCKESDVNLIVDEAQKIRNKCDVFVVLGVGGSYLGARAAIEFLRSRNYNLFDNLPKIFFVGNSISSDELYEIMQICQGKEVCINVISKSGTTLEPSIAFRFFKNFLENKYGREEAKNHIYCTAESGSRLRKFADKMGYTSFEIPKNIGGRYSVLSAVGLLPMAVSGINIKSVIAGSLDAMNNCSSSKLSENDCYKYAVYRNLLYGMGKSIELFVGYHPKMHYFMEWCKQLFGESEGKNGKGIFPASAIFSTDLHSLGQYIQQGSKILFETIINIEQSKNDLYIGEDSDNFDGLNYLCGKSVNFVNQKAFDATILAHSRGGVPNIIINVDSFSEYNFGYLVYFFEKACAISAYILGVNPFDQPGVENYKQEMFRLLGKSSFGN